MRIVLNDEKEVIATEGDVAGPFLACHLDGREFLVSEEGDVFEKGKKVGTAPEVEEKYASWTDWQATRGMELLQSVAKTKG